ncbi:unnamed protein product [Rhizoctonia solani]|uniref:RING-type domain-containing protein n=1 Tax=Rhizoctonia solani TaxID=456999 RepID=A0A8H2XHP7_9AGAM|nr:unnamed protein product [Rhizoctonia solani]
MQASPTDKSIWEYVHCSVCMMLFLPPNRTDPVPDIPFWLTECGHVICNNHLMADQSCASCRAKNPTIVPLQRNMSPPVSEWFRPLADAHENLVMASRIQHNMFVALIRHYRQRYDTAKVMIKQLQAELVSLRGQVSVYFAFYEITSLTRSVVSNPQGYQAASPQLGPLEQRGAYESGYTSSTGSASKRRRVDMEGAGSSPHSHSTPNRPTMVFTRQNSVMGSYENGGMARSTEYGNQLVDHRPNTTSHQSGMRTLDAQQYAFLPPSTPLRSSAAMNVNGQHIPETLVRRATSRPQSAAVMPPPALDVRRMTARTSSSLSGNNAHGGTNVGPSAGTHTGGFAGRPLAPQQNAQRLAFKERGSTPRAFGVRDGRRFIPGMPVGSKSRFAAG